MSFSTGLLVNGVRTVMAGMLEGLRFAHCFGECEVIYNSAARNMHL
jgi:hypothetical protein